MSSSVTGVDHIGIVVRDIDAALPYYVNHLGFTLVGDETTQASGGARLVYLDAGNILLQLLSPSSTEGPIAEHVAQFGEGLHHICLTVDDIDHSLTLLAPDSEVAVVVGGRGRRTAFLPQCTNNFTTELTESRPFQPKSDTHSKSPN